MLGLLTSNERLTVLTREGTDMKCCHLLPVVFLAGIALATVSAEAQQFARRVNHPGGLFAIALMDSAQKDIGIETDAEKLRLIRELGQAAQKEVLEAVGKVAPGRLDELQASAREVREKHEIALLKLLTPQEGLRLQQIHWQLMGWRAASDRKMATRIELSEEQKAAVAELVRLEVENQKELFRTAGLSANDRLAKVTEWATENQRKIHDLLSAEQQKKYAEALGPAFEQSTPVNPTSK